MAIVNAQIKNVPTNILDPNGLNDLAGAVPSGQSWAITNILICNTSDTITSRFTMHLVPQGNPVNDRLTMVVNDLTLPPGETFTFDSEKIVLSEGDKVVVVGFPDDGNGIGNTTLASTVSYLEV